MTYEHHQMALGFTALVEPRELRRMWRWAVPKNARVVDDSGLKWFRPLVELPSIIGLMQGGIDRASNPWWQTSNYESGGRSLRNTLNDTKLTKSLKI